MYIQSTRQVPISMLIGGGALAIIVNSLYHNKNCKNDRDTKSQNSSRLITVSNIR